MATFNVLTDNDFDMFDYDFYSFATALPGNTTTFGWISPDGTLWLATGVGFTYDANGMPTSGVITNLTAISGGVVVLQASGLSADAAMLMTAGTSDFYDIVMPGSDTMTFGGDGDDTVLDFNQGYVIELDVDGFDSFSDITNAWHQIGSDLILDFGQEGSLKLAGINHYSLDQSDFNFV